MVLSDTLNEDSLSSMLRRRRDVGLRKLLASISSKKGSVRLLDMGGTFGYWKRVGIDFLREQHVSVLLLNLVPSELTPDQSVSDVIKSAVGDACNLKQYADNEFDLAHSNSVIEHVITWQNMKAFASETRRVAPSFYVQTPYFWFPFDPHHHRVPMFHWYPRPLRARLLNLLPISKVGKISGVDSAYEVIDNNRMLDGRQFRFLFPDANIHYERLLGLAKSIIAVRLG